MIFINQKRNLKSAVGRGELRVQESEKWGQTSLESIEPANYDDKYINHGVGT